MSIDEIVKQQYDEYVAKIESNPIFQGKPMSLEDFVSFRGFYVEPNNIKMTNGGKGSGNFGHSGRPGEVGGSASVETTGNKTILDSAKKQTWESFQKTVKQNIDEAKKSGIDSNKKMREFWRRAKLEDFTKKDVHELTKEDAEDIIYKAIPKDVWYGWFWYADSNYKPVIETLILDDKKVRNAGINLAWQIYKDTTKKNISLKDFLNTKITLYRGEIENNPIESDVFTSYTTNRSIAEKFAHGTKLKQIKMYPLETLGCYAPNRGESEIFVPRFEETNNFFANGGKGSGNFGHSGRPGEVGGSSASEHSSAGENTVYKKMVNSSNLNDEEKKYAKYWEDYSAEFLALAGEDPQDFDYDLEEFEDGRTFDEGREFFDSMIRKRKFPEDAVVYRRLQFTTKEELENAVRKNFISDTPQATSATLNPKQIQEAKINPFALGDKENRIILKINVKKGQSGLALDNPMDEIILPRHSEFKVIKEDEKIDGITTYNVDYIEHTSKETFNFVDFEANGGKGSGNFGHAGRIGEVGGSSSRKETIPLNYEELLATDGPGSQQKVGSKLSVEFLRYIENKHPEFINREKQDENLKRDYEEYKRWSNKEDKVHNLSYEEYKKKVLAREIDADGRAREVFSSIYELPLYGAGAAPFLEGLVMYAYGANIHHGQREEFDKKYGLSDTIDKNKDLWTDYNKPLYRGVNTNEEGLNQLKKGVTISMKGLSSWSSEKDIADHFTKYSLIKTGDIPVVFVDKSKTHDRTMFYPFSSSGESPCTQYEYIQSGSKQYKITDVHKEGDIYYADVESY